MQLDRESCQRARIARDPRFDGVLLHCRQNHEDLLPPHLSGALTERTERRLLPFGGRSGRGGIPAVSSLPARSFTRHAGLAGYVRRPFPERSG